MLGSSDCLNITHAKLTAILAYLEDNRIQYPDDLGDELINSINRMRDYITETVSVTHVNKLLTTHQLKILKLIAEGKTNEEIAQELFISINTVKSNVHRIFLACRVTNRVQAADYYNSWKTRTPIIT